MVCILGFHVWERRGGGEGEEAGEKKGEEGRETYVAHSLASIVLMMYSPVPKACTQCVKLKKESECIV